MGSVLEILVLRSIPLALEGQGNRTHALADLEQALLLAALEGYIRLFVDEGPPMLASLRLAQARSRVPGYVATLLSAFGEQQVDEYIESLGRLLHPCSVQKERSGHDDHERAVEDQGQRRELGDARALWEAFFRQDQDRKPRHCRNVHDPQGKKQDEE